MTSIDIEYSENAQDITFKCFDGYANGSISTNDHFTINGEPSPVDLDGFHNITLGEWTNYKRMHNGVLYRVPEVNDCEIFKTMVTQRMSLGD